MIYLYLFYEFFKTGLFAIGGGLATLPFLYTISDKYGWFTHANLADMIAVSESTPGPIGVNMSTYTGYHVAGIPGALVATFALVLPSFIIILIVAKFLNQFNENKLVRSAFYGLRPAVCGLIASAGWGVVKMALFAVDAYQASGSLMDLFHVKAIVLFAALLFAIFKFKKHPIVYIAAAAAVGIVIGV